MLKRLKEKEEKIAQTLEALIDLSCQGTPILVEGKKDFETLRMLGVQGQILSVKAGGRSYLDIVSGLEGAGIRQVILLLDFDRRGKQGTNRLRHNLERAGIKVKLEHWLRLLTVVGKDVQCIEGLASYLENLRAKTAKS